MLPIFTGGRMSRSVQTVIDAVGLQSALGMRLPYAYDRNVSVWPLPFKLADLKGRLWDFVCGQIATVFGGSKVLELDLQKRKVDYCRLSEYRQHVYGARMIARI